MSLTALRPDPAKIIVPRKHAQLLIEPPLKTLANFLNSPTPQSPASTTPRNNDASITPESLPALRQKARAHFLQSATQWANLIGAPPPPNDAAQKPWLITGHQVEFYHAGVWAKVLATTELANRTNAIPFDLLVDHDTVAELGFDIPLQKNGTWSRARTEFAPPSPLPATSLTPPTLEQFEHWDATIARSPQSHTDSLAFFLSSLRAGLNLNPQDSGLKTHPSYTAWMSRARSQFERSLNIHIHHIPTTLACSGEAWENFVHAWIQNADAWTTLYNQHLAAYRKSHDIKNDQHPMPDLQRTHTPDGTTYELPFWLYKTGFPRERLFIHKKNTGETTIQLPTYTEPLSSFIVQHSSFKILPRALTLTLFIRLFLADLFIHGIGGALYDQITDNLLQELTGTIPPYACVSAAWLLPLGGGGQPLESNNDIPTLKSQIHHTTHNPHLALDPFTARKPEFAALITDRQNLLQQITTSLATDRHSLSARQSRQKLFQQLHQINQSLHQKSPQLLTRLNQQLTTALHTQQQNKTLLHREYFFPLHTTESLQKLIQQIHNQ